MVCRSTNTRPSLSCFGGNNGGAQLSYDNEQRLIGWQNAPTSPTTTDAFLYDGEGNRVEQQVTQSGVTTTTAYVGQLEESATSGSTSTTTTYYYAGSLRIALAVGGPATGTVSYLGTDALGSSTVALSASGTETATQLYDPYGNGRYSNGAMPTDYAYTGQHSGAATGLDYYNARYYDPLASQFTTADSVLPGKGYDPWGLSRYAYVEGNPETRTDPTGRWSLGICVGGSGGFIVGGFGSGCAVVAVSGDGDLTAGITGTVGGGAYLGVGGISKVVPNSATPTASMISVVGLPMSVEGSVLL